MTDRLPQDDNEHRRRRMVAWLAAGGTFAVIVVLWVALLPMQLGDLSGFGARNSPAWQAFRERTSEQAAEFDQSLAEIRQQLDLIESAQMETARRESAETETELLRQRIEASTSAVVAPAEAGPVPPPTQIP